MSSLSAATLIVSNEKNVDTRRGSENTSGRNFRPGPPNIGTVAVRKILGTHADLYHELRLCFNFFKAPTVSRTRPDPRTKSVHVEIERTQWTVSETRTDQRSFSEIRVRSGPCSGIWPLRHSLTHYGSKLLLAMKKPLVAIGVFWLVQQQILLFISHEIFVARLFGVPPHPLQRVPAIAASPVAMPLDLPERFSHVGNKSVPKSIINGTINLFLFKLQSTFR